MSVTRSEVRNGRQWLSGTCVGIVHDRHDDPEEENETKEYVDFGPPWKHQWTANPRDLRPIERHYGHAHARVDAEQLIDWNVIWHYPTHPRKHGESTEKIS